MKDFFSIMMKGIEATAYEQYANSTVILFTEMLVKHSSSTQISNALHDLKLKMRDIMEENIKKQPDQSLVDKKELRRVRDLTFDELSKRIWEMYVD